MLTTSNWSGLLKEESALHAVMLKAVEAGKPINPQVLRRWWSAVASVLEAMIRPDGRFSEPLPMELFIVLRELARYLAVGKIPFPISDVATKGRTSPGPSEVRDIRLAVTYRHAVKKKLIKDPVWSK